MIRHRDYARRSRMRDMARRRRDPKTGRYMRDRRHHMEDFRYDGNYPMRTYREYDSRYGDMEHSKRMGADYTMGRQPNRQYSGYYGDTPFYTREIRDFNYYGDYGEEMMSEDELCDWYDDLVEELEPNEKEMFKMEKIEKRAEEMGMKFKDYSPEALAVVTVMLYDDYKDTIGRGNLDMYMKLAKDWFEDDDAELNGEEKLVAYHDYIVMPE